MARARYEVVPSGGDWRVTGPGGDLGTYADKDDAIDAGVAAAQANQPSQLIIKKADGTIQDERTYGDDPFPPSG